MGASRIRECCRSFPAPMLDCFFFSIFDRGLSTVEADEPDTRDGVRVLSGTSSLGWRDDKVCVVGLGVIRRGSA